MMPTSMKQSQSSSKSRVLDVNTPGVNGFEVLKEARENDVVAPAIYITSLDSVDDLEKGFESGCDDYIRKPFELKELLIRVETLLKRSFFHEAKELRQIADNITYDIKSNELIVDEEVVNLGNKEARLLKSMNGSTNICGISMKSQAIRHFVPISKICVKS